MYMSNISSRLVEQDLKALAKPTKAVILSRFFKTGKGEYAEGDKFLGVVVPDIRLIAKKYVGLSLSGVEKLIHSPWHEIRLTGLIILTYQYPKSSPAQQKKIYKLYIKSLKYINNWDLVDLTADRIVGQYLRDKDKEVLFTLSQSPNLWKRRVSIMATFCYIKQGDPTLTYKLALNLLHDPHDLIHKAVGWMLRETGKRCSKQGLVSFLNKHSKDMPRTMLRYAIEHFPKQERMGYLTKPRTK